MHYVQKKIMNLFLARLPGIQRIRMKVAYVITSRLSLIFQEIFGNLQILNLAVISPFRVIEGNRFLYQSKVLMRLPISE